MADDPWAEFSPPSQKTGADPWAEFTPEKPREKTFVEKTPLVANFPESYGKARGDATSAMSRGVEQVGRALSGQGEDKTMPFFGARPELGGITASEGVRGLGNLIAGGVGYVTSPIMGAIDAGAGKPVEELTGGKVPREYTNFAASLAVPYMGLTKVGKTAPTTSARPGNDVVQASGRLAEEGMPVNVPTGLATDSRFKQSATQVLRQSPVGGKVVENAVDDFFSGVSGAKGKVAQRVSGRAEDAAPPSAQEIGGDVRQKVNAAVEGNQATHDTIMARVNAVHDAANQSSTQRLAKAKSDFESLAPGSETTRAAASEDIGQSIKTRIDANREAQSQGYDELRRVINPDQPVNVSQTLGPTVGAVLRERQAASQGGLPKALQPALDISTNPEGVTFSGLQRARSTLGEQIDFEVSQGFNAGDLKRVYGAMTDAMRDVVARSGFNPQAALAAFEKAETNFERLAETNQKLSALSRGNPEAMVDRVIQAASGRAGGNIRDLAFVARELPPEEFGKVSRLAFGKLSQDAAGNFSPDTLAKNWANTSPRGRTILFGEAAARIDRAINNLSEAARAAEEIPQKTGELAKTYGQMAGERLKESNRQYLALLGKSDEQIVDTMLGWASSGSRADIRRLVDMSALVGKEGMDGLASVAVQRLGMSKGGDFSANLFRSGWNNLSDSAKALMFKNEAHRRNLEDINTISRRMAEVEGRFANRSNTGRVGGLVAMASAAPPVVMAGFAGSFVEPVSFMTTALGSYVAARVLAEPATASSAAKWTRAYAAVAHNQSPTNVSALARASRNFGATIESNMKVPNPANDLMNVFGPRRTAASDGQQQQETD